jgi:PAS domain S-box-containing protein/putative nucleotidyltransferase with HDIG domain
MKQEETLELNERQESLEDVNHKLQQRVAELEQSEERLHRLIDTAGDGIYILDLKLNYKWVNEAMERLLQHPRSEIVGQHASMFASREQIREHGERDQNQLVAGGPTDPLEYHGQVEGKPAWREVSNWVVMKEGEPFEIVGIMRDVTKRKLAEIELQKSLERIRTTLTATVSALAYAVEMRDPYTAGHQRRVADLACALGEVLELSDDELDGVKLAALIHDVGKMRVPTDILTNPGKLTDAEFSIIKTHSQVGYEVLKGIEFVRPVADIVHQHHERVDGSGYPQGLVGDEILFEARILAIADVVEAMASHRPYRPALGLDVARREIEEHTGTRYDSRVAEACVKLLDELNYQLPQ